MFRHLVLCLLLCISGLAAFAATTTVVLNGQAVTVPVIESNGKAFVDIAALMKLLGGSATFNADAHKLFINSSGQSTTGAGAAGTAEIAGDNGELGKIYTLRKDNPLYFCLKSADYTTNQVVIGDSLYVPAAEEKLLLLHFTVQNPQKTDTLVRGDMLRFMAVDAMNANHQGEQTWGNPENHQIIDLMLKPAQKIEAYAFITVPAKGVVPKLMVQSNLDNDGPVLRYDLHGKVTPLPAPIADPADTTGATALTEVPAQLNTAYSYEKFDITVEKFAYTTDKLDADAPENDGRFLVVTLLFKNKAPTPTLLRNDQFTPGLTSTDGEELKYSQSLLFATTNRAIEQDLKPGQEMRARIYFAVPKGVTGKTFTLKENNSRMFLFAVKE